MRLTAVAIRALKPAEKAYKETDGGGLHLLVTPAGGKLWRMNFRFAGRQQTLALGAFPEVGLAEARVARDEAKRLIAQGVNPAAEKQARKRGSLPAPKAPRGPTVGELARAYMEKRRREGAAAATMDKMNWFMDTVGEEILAMAPDTVEPRKILERLRVYEASGHLEKVARTRTFLARVYAFAIASGDAKTNPCALLSEALASPQVTHHPTIFEPSDFGKLLQSFDSYRGDPSVHFALRLGPVIFLRSAEIRRLRWNHVRWSEELIRVPGSVMKNHRDHIVPLSRQARALLEEVLPWSGPGGGRNGNGLIFPGAVDKSRPLSENTLNSAMRRMGYDKSEITFHGLRRTASTWLNESGLFESDWIELQLDHVDRDTVRRTYNAAEYLEHRRRMMQWWADRLDEVKLAS
ncbi:tyrosine-type recombinase/integrase [Rubellimicrobium arenae]|uniref:tyrosine-type recombinase/integrase n=1 Tax=Rubellimicrobium arenae TaxID=2817372 RepID=UPI001B305694|nr:integrase arm-type DNA-binding domain-containing protein [Rubellimicrobium arenae]